MTRWKSKRPEKSLGTTLLSALNPQCTQHPEGTFLEDDYEGLKKICPGKSPAIRNWTRHTVNIRISNAKMSFKMGLCPDNWGKSKLQKLQVM